MTAFKKFLFPYSIVSVTIIFISIVFFAPKPGNFVYAILLFPIVFYFWIENARSKNNTISAPRGIFTILVVSIFLSLIISGITTYLFTSKDNFAEPQTKDAANMQEDVLEIPTEEVKGVSDASNVSLDELKAEIAQIHAEQRIIAEKLGIDTLQVLENNVEEFNPDDTPNQTPLILGTLEVKSNDSVKVHLEPTSSSRTIGTITKGNVYTYHQINGNWYQIETDEKTTGWVFADFININ